MNKATVAMYDAIQNVLCMNDRDAEVGRAHSVPAAVVDALQAAVDVVYADNDFRRELHRERAKLIRVRHAAAA